MTQPTIIVATIPWGVRTQFGFDNHALVNSLIAQGIKVTYDDAEKTFSFDPPAHLFMDPMRQWVVQQPAPDGTVATSITKEFPRADQMHWPAEVSADTEPRDVQIAVWEGESTGGDLPWMTLHQAMKFLHSKWLTVPEDMRETAEFNISANCDAGYGTTLTLTVEYTRKETAAEVDRRIQQAKDLLAAKKEDRRRQFEALKREFDQPEGR